MNPSSAAQFEPLRLAELWELLVHGDESQAIEAKRSEEIGKSILETVSAFANEHGAGGGYLLLGVERPGAEGGYTVVGVSDAEKIQNDLATQCRTAFNVVIRPHIALEQMDGKSVIVAFIAEARPHEKPVHITSRGLPGGAFRRIGASDQHCTEEDLAQFYQLRGQSNYEEMILADGTLDDLEPRAIAEYRRLRRAVNPNAVELGYDDEDLLSALGAVGQRDGRLFPTAAGLILFGTPFALRRQLPMLRVDYIRVAGRQWVENPNDRYEWAVELREPLILLAASVIRQVMEDLLTAFSLSEDGIYRRDIPEIPTAVIREAVVNALMHQNFRISQPTQIIRYANRLEIRNPGSSLVSVDQMGEPGSWPRNPRIAAVMHDVALAENKGTGIRIMREAMEQANLTVPLFDSDRAADRFVVTLLRHHLLNDEDIEWLAHFRDCNLSEDEVRALVVVRENEAINNSMYRDVCRVDTLTASKYLQRLRDLDVLEQRGKSSGTYYVPGKRFVESLATTNWATPPRLNTGYASLPVELSSTGKRLDSHDKGGNSTDKQPPPPLPRDLSEAVHQLGRRSTVAQVRDTIVSLCGWQPLSAAQLAAIIGRQQTYLLDSYLRPMLREGLLKYAHPENPNHPLQAYRAQRAETEDEGG